LIILIMLGGENKLRSFSIYSFLQSPATSSLFGQNILLSILFSRPQSRFLCEYPRNVSIYMGYVAKLTHPISIQVEIAWMIRY
jgi:hypothetical protein